MSARVSKYTIYLCYILVLLIFPIQNFYQFNIEKHNSNYMGSKYDLIISTIYLLLFIIVWLRNKESEVLGWILISGLVLSVCSYLYKDWNGINYFPFLLMYLALISLINKNKTKGFLNIAIIPYYLYSIIPLFTVTYGYFVKDIKFYDTDFTAFFIFIPIILSVFFILLFYLFNKIQLNKILLPILIFYIYALLSIVYAVFTQYYNFGVHMVWLYNVLGIVFLILSLLTYKIKNFDFKNFYNYVYITYILISLVSLIKLFYYAKFIYHSLDVIFVYKTLYSYPTMSTSNYTYAILNVLFLLIFNKRKYFNYLSLSILWALQLINSFITLSRGGLLAFAAVIFIYFTSLIYKFIINIKYKRLKLSSAVIALIVVLILILTYKDIYSFIFESTFAQRFKNMSTDPNVTWRVDKIKVYFDSFKNSPLFNRIFGRGLSEQLDLVKRPHNIYILVLNQMGIVGLGLFLSIMSYYLYRFRRSTLGLVILYILIHSLVEPLLFSFWMDTILIVFILQSQTQLEGIKHCTP